MKEYKLCEFVNIIVIGSINKEENLDSFIVTFLPYLFL